MRSFNSANTAQIFMEESGHSNSYVGMGVIKSEIDSRHFMLCVLRMKMR